MLKIDSESPKEIDAFVKGISKSIVVGSKDNSTSGILEIKFRAGAPWLAQQIGTTILDIGQEELRLVRINRSSIILNRLSIAVAQSRNEWDTTTQAFTLYKDRNRSILLPEQQLELSRLEMEKSAKEQKYLLARKEYEIQLLEQAKAAPPMMILDPANLPYRMISPKRKIIISIGLFASLFISVSTITIRILFSKIIANLIKKP
jgi:hypothetical protein